MNKEFVTYEQALALKELGFDEPCFGSWEIDYCKVPTYTHSIRCFGSEFYKNSNHSKGKITAPLYQQAFRWFRKEHGLYSSIIPKKSWPDDYVTGIEFYVSICGGDGKEIGPEGVFSCEEAEQACLNKLIEIVKQSANK